MAEIEYLPEDRREKIDDALARGQLSRAIELLEVWVTQFAVTPWAMQLLGELQLQAGNRDRAGFAFFWSGNRGHKEHEACIEGWLRSLRRQPGRIVKSLSQRARLPVAQMPGVLPEELGRLKVTDAVSAKANKPPTPVMDWVIGIAVLWCLLVGAIVSVLYVIDLIRNW